MPTDVRTRPPIHSAAAVPGASGHALATAGTQRRCVLSIVVPVYNEQDNVASIYARLVGVLDPVEHDWELIFSVDPCTDRTEELILELCAEDPRVKMLRFSRRFGQPMATIAGLEEASGEAVVVVDCDLQDPPELIPELVLRWREGYDVVYAQRRTRAGETLPKRIVSSLGYRLIKRIADVEIPPNTGDFRLMSRRVVDNVVSLKEGHGFLRGLVGLVGFRQTSVLYDRDPRCAGSSKYNRFLGSMLIGLNGIVGFSRYPLQLISMLGMAPLGPRIHPGARIPRPEARRAAIPRRRSDDRDRHVVLQWHPAALARCDRRVRRTHLRRIAKPPEVHRRVAPRVARRRGYAKYR